MHANGRALFLSALFYLALVNSVQAGRSSLGLLLQRSAPGTSKSTSPSPPKPTPPSPSPTSSPLLQDGATAPSTDVSNIPFFPFDELDIPHLEDIVGAGPGDDDDVDQAEAAPINSTISQAIPSASASAASGALTTPPAASTASGSICDYRCRIDFCRDNDELCMVTIVEAGSVYCRFFSGCPSGRPPFSRIYIPFSPFGSAAQGSNTNPFSLSSDDEDSSPVVVPFADVLGELQG